MGEGHDPFAAHADDHPSLLSPRHYSSFQFLIDFDLYLYVYILTYFPDFYFTLLLLKITVP